MLTSLKYGFYTFNHIIKISLSKYASWIHMDFCDKDRGDVNLICLGIDFCDKDRGDVNLIYLGI